MHSVLRHVSLLLLGLAFPCACGGRIGSLGDPGKPAELAEPAQPAQPADGGSATAPSRGPDKPREAGAPDAAPILPPPIPSDVPEADLDGCTSGTTNVAYLVTSDALVLRLDPDTGTTAVVGEVNCTTSSHPFALTSSRDGTLYALYVNGALYRFDPATLACTQTPFLRGQLGFPSNVGVAVSRGAPSEEIFVYGLVGGSPTLGRGDLTAFTLTSVGSINVKASFPVDLQADPYNRLFALSHAGEVMNVHPKTGALLGKDRIPGMLAGSWSLLPWRRNVIAFTSGVGGPPSKAIHWDLESKTATTRFQLPYNIVGSTAPACTP